MLLCDGHASYITTQAIRFCIALKIIPLCLPPYTTHILQPLDNGLFSALAIRYSKALLAKFQFAIYNITKVDFLEIYQSVREQAFSEHNIASAWAKVGLLPYNLALILDKLPKPIKRPIIPPQAVLSVGTLQIVTNSVNIRTVTLNKMTKARSIGSSEYKNLKLKKKEEKKRAEGS
jgi:hypothetical protein